VSLSRAIARVVLLLALAVSMAGCQTVQHVGSKLQGAVDKVLGSKGDRLDPWESWNRKVFAFNEKLDEAVLKPVAKAYVAVVPSPVRTGVGNFIGNIQDAWSAVNLFLQGRFKAGAEQTMRVAINTGLGLAGVLDIASDAGLDKNTQDLGKTLGKWGVGTGAYVVWPVLGPSSLRDSLAMPVDMRVAAPVVFDDGAAKTAIGVLGVVNTRASLLKAGELVDGIALDKYVFYRDAYLQRRGHFDDDDEVELLVPEEPAKPADKTDKAEPAKGEGPQVRKPAEPAPNTRR
jgi:phospholipid-binding lipoprotein MlaA